VRKFSHSCKTLRETRKDSTTTQVLRHDLRGIGAIGLEDPHCPGGADPVTVQEDHDFAHDLLFGPGGENAGRTKGPDAIDIAQPIRGGLDLNSVGGTTCTGMPNTSMRGACSNHSSVTGTMPCQDAKITSKKWSPWNTLPSHRSSSIEMA